MEDLKKYIPIYLRVCRALILYFSFLAIFGISYLFSGFEKIAGAILLPLVFHSTARVFGETDKRLIDLALAYRAEKDVHHCMPREILRLILTSKDLLLELGILLALPIIFPIELGFSPLVKLLFGSTAVSRALKKLLTLAIVLPLFFGLWLFSRHSAFFWIAYREKESQIHFVRDLVLKLLGITAIYALGSIFIIYSIEIYLSIFYILKAFFSLYFWPTLILVCGIIAFFLSFRFLRACRIRRKFFKRLKVLCREIGATLSPIKRPYRSLLFLRDEVNFTVQYNQKTYHCKLFCSLKRHTPLFFSQNGIMQCLHSLRFRRVEYFRYTTQFDFSFEAQGPKMLIVNPVPKELYAGDTTFYREIDTGESIGAYKVFTATGFLGALSRNVLDR